MTKQIIATIAMYACCCNFAAATVIDQWDFTGGSTLSSNGVDLAFFTTGQETEDTDGNNQLNVTRGNGFSSNVSLGGSFSAANTKSITLSVSLADFDFSQSNDQELAFEFRSGTSTIEKLKLDAHPTALNTRLSNGPTIAGIALDSTATTDPLTYGLTLNFEENTYTYWIGTPTSGGETWFSRFQNYTGTLDLSTASIDGIRPTILKHATGDRFNIDQLQVSYEAIPEPATFGLTLLGGGLMIYLRKS